MFQSPTPTFQPPISNLRPPFFGFTLLEVLLVIALLAGIGGMSMVLARDAILRHDLDIATTVTVQSFRRAQALARAGDGDAPWGVRVDTGVVLLFRGSSYSSRDQTADEAMDISPAITPSGTLEVVFAAGTGLPMTTGMVTLTHAEGATHTVTVNEEGIVTY